MDNTSKDGVVMRHLINKANATSLPLLEYLLFEHLEFEFRSHRKCLNPLEYFITEVRGVDPNTDAIIRAVADYLSTTISHVAEMGIDYEENITLTEKNCGKISPNFDAYIFELTFRRAQKDSVETPGSYIFNESFIKDGNNWVFRPYIRLTICGMDDSEIRSELWTLLGHELTHLYSHCENARDFSRWMNRNAKIRIFLKKNKIKTIYKYKYL